MKVRNKKVIYTIIGIVAVILVTIAASYALWLITKTQTGQNTVSSACLEIELSNESNDITLSNQFPISDEEGMKLTPYTFTVTNKCNTSLDYQVALESIGDESTALNASSLKVALNDNISLLSKKASVETTIEGAYASNRLTIGTLEAKASVTYNLRIWIDYEAPNSEQNKTYGSKISVTVGQNIANPYKEGTLAYDILLNYGGTSAITEIDTNNYAHTAVGTTSNLYVSLNTPYEYGTSYTYDESSGTYALAGDIVSATLSECRSESKNCGKYTVQDWSGSYGVWEIINFQSSGNYTTAQYIYYSNKLGAGTKQNDVGIYKALDDYGDSYYFRGNPENNYVEFGKWAENINIYTIDNSGPNGFEYFFSLEECESTLEGYGIDWMTCDMISYSEYSNDPMYWRIVRINGDGTIRLVYDGLKLVENGTTHDATTFLSVDDWYKINLKDNYGNYIADSIFCKDKSDVAFNRFFKTKTLPTLSCPNKNDRYTVDDTTNGNGLLENPVGFITADEVNFAGSAVLEASPWYALYFPKNQNYLTSTGPYFTSDGMASNFDDKLFYNAAASYNIYEVKNRPVINLKSDVQFTGSGTLDDPYVIVTN